MRAFVCFGFIYLLYIIVLVGHSEVIELFKNSFAPLLWNVMFTILHELYAWSII